MVIPVGPPGVQHVLKVAKQQAGRRRHQYRALGYLSRAAVSPSCRFTKLDGDLIKGTHSGR